MFLKLSKLFVSLLIIYVVWYTNAYSTIPYMLQIFAVCMVSSLSLHILKKYRGLKIYLSKELLWWVVFGIYAFVSGVFISKDISYLISSLGTYFSFLLICICVFYISKEINNIDWILKIFIITAILCSISTILFGYDYNNGVHVITMGPNSNPNSLGIIMCIGIFSVLYMIDMKRNINLILSFIKIAIFIYVAIICGSRKSFIVCIMLVLIWFLFIQNDKLKDISKTKKIIYICCVSIIAMIVCIYFFTQFFETAIFERFEILFTGNNTMRKELYKESIIFFMKNPILGIGYNQFRLNSSYKTYSHSTYAEILSCTGIIGALLYFAPYLLILKKLLERLIVQKNINDERYYIKICICMMTLILFLGIGMIHFYDIEIMLIITIMFIFINLNQYNKN